MSLVAASLFGFLPVAVAHGFIEFPALRGGTGGKPANAWCPHCGNGAGICGDGGQWGGSSDFLNFARGPVTTLRAGEVAEFSVKITAHHRGFFEFRICDQHLDGSVSNPEACLNQHRLRRMPPAADCKVNDARGDCQPLDSRHPDRWYLPPGTGTYKMKYEIPADLRCSSCTLQWQWFTANSCIPGADTGCYWADFAAQGWDRGSWCGVYCGSCSSLIEANSTSVVGSTKGCGEEFRNCADIAVVGGAVASSPSPVPSPQTASPSPAASSEPETEPETEPEAEGETAFPGTPPPVPVTTSPETPAATLPSMCGSCRGCMWSHGVCYMDASKSYCEMWSDNTWCGSSLVEVQRHKTFLGLGLIQDGALVGRLIDEL